MPLSAGAPRCLEVRNPLLSVHPEFVLEFPDPLPDVFPRFGAQSVFLQLAFQSQEFHGLAVLLTVDLHLAFTF